MNNGNWISAGKVGALAGFGISTMMAMTLGGIATAGATEHPVEFTPVHSFTMADGRNPSCSYEKDLVNLTESSLEVVAPDGTLLDVAPSGSERIRLYDPAELLELTDGETKALVFVVDGLEVEDPLSIAPRCAPQPETEVVPDASVVPDAPVMPENPVFDDPPVGPPVDTEVDVLTAATPGLFEPVLTPDPVRSDVDVRGIIVTRAEELPFTGVETGSMLMVGLGLLLGGTGLLGVARRRVGIVR